MPVTLEQNESDCVLHLDGEVGIGTAAELKTLLSQALSTGRDVRINMVRVTEVDVTVMQLIWAAAREADKLRRRLSVAAGVPEEILAAWADAGLAKPPVPTEVK
jgi:ABC-type transporter Mla MlaB component